MKTTYKLFDKNGNLRCERREKEDIRCRLLSRIRGNKIYNDLLLDFDGNLEKAGFYIVKNN